MKMLLPRPLKVEHEFTDDRLTGFGGCSALASTARRLDLFRALADAVSVKTRCRGPSDSATLWTLIASLASGGGALSDLDALRSDPTACRLLGLRDAAASRRMGEFLAKVSESDVDGLLGAARKVAKRIAPAVIGHEVEERGYVPVFVDGTEIEVGGELFEGAGRSHCAERALMLHAVFVGGLWASGRLHPGGVHAAHGWKGQLESDVEHLLPEGTPVWVRADNAYYAKSFAKHCKERNWDYSISVTHPKFKAPVLEMAEGLPKSAWEDIGPREQATRVLHKASGWEEHSYIVIRKFKENGQGELFPARAVIVVSRGDLPIAEMVKRHRGKQGQENAFKGPLRDLDLHHPPCRKLLANQAFYICGQLAQMLLRSVQYDLLPREARRHGLRPLIRHFIRTVARLVSRLRPLAARLRKVQLPRRLAIQRRRPAGVTAALPPPRTSETRSNRPPGGMPSAPVWKNVPETAAKH